MINDYIKKLRRAADVLEDLLSSDPFSRPQAARALAARVGKHLDAPVEVEDERVDGRHARKGYKYNGTHWTQQAKGKRRLSVIVKATARAKREQERAAILGEPAPEPQPAKLHHAGLHWTQKPEHAETVKRMHRKMMLTQKKKKQAAKKGAK